MRDDGRPGLGHIGGVEVCEVHGEEEVGGGRWQVDGSGSKELHVICD